ncbi:MAG: beta strand repeat-containing protein [Rariglobus sp.]
MACLSFRTTQRTSSIASRILALCALLGGSSSAVFAQTLVGLNFVGGATGVTVNNLAGATSAGSVAQTNWNNLASNSGTDSTLVNSAGTTVSGLSVTYSSTNTWADSAVADTAGNLRLMRGYLDQNTNTAVTSLTVSGLGYGSGIYDVYVYSAGDGNNRVGQYTIGDQSFWVKDSATFAGTFTQGTGQSDPGSVAAATSGNYMVFSTVTGSSFTLDASGAYSNDSFRAPVNAIQIIEKTNVLYWDRNNNTAGAGTTPDGRWATSGGSRANWNTTAAGTGTPGNWTQNSIAVFSAGTDSTGTYTAELRDDIQVDAVIVQEGNVTIGYQTAGDDLVFNDSTPDFIVASGASATVTTNITGSNGLTKSGAGTLTLSDLTKTYTGNTTVNGGTLRLGAGNMIANTSSLILGAGGTFDLNGFSETVNSISGSGTIATGGGTLSFGSSGANSLFGGTVTGSTGTLEKLGSGTLTFNSDLNFTGTLKLNAGTLALNGHDITLGTLHITGNSVIDFGSAASSLLAGTLIIDAGVTLTINNWNDTVDFFYATNFNGVILNVRGDGAASQVIFTGAPGGGASTIWQGYDKQITPVPEPATYGALFMAIATGGWFFQRHRRS